MTNLDKPEFIYLKQEDVIAAGGLDMKLALADVELAFKMHGQDEVIQPNKTVIEFPDQETGHRRYLTVSMPAYLGGQINRAGIKWAAESLDNARRGDLPYGMDVIILHDLERAHPVAMMDGTLITAIRTGAAAGVAAKYLARPDSKIAAFIGAGVIGRTTLEAIGLSLPGLTEFRIFDLDAEKAQAVAAAYSNQWQIQVVKSTQAAVDGADVIGTMTTTRHPFVKAGWLKAGCFVAAMGKNEFEEQALLEADLLVVDEWEQFKHYQPSLLAHLYQTGRLQDEDIINLRDIILNRVPGRTAAAGRIHFLSFGLACEDLVVAERVYQTAASMGLGQSLSLWDEPHWL
jgi:ornithine cyclodeaminase/alanine dehydrogenase-like protein (mu-crystallin family)